MELTSERGVEVVDELLHLTVHIDNVSRGGWVALQWFDPRNRERASDSLWIEPNHSALRHTFVLSEHVEVTPGRWRAVVSFEGEILRQFSVDIP